MEETLRHTLEAPALALVVGLLLLVLGRRLYLLFVAVVGFLAGAWLVTFLELGPPWLWLVVASLVGLAGAFVALVAQRLAVGLAGFLLGGTVSAALVDGYRIGLEGIGVWLLPLLGGLLTALLLVAVFDVALILLSSLLGSGLLVEASGTGGLVGVSLFALLLCIGIAVQIRGLERRPTKTVET